MMNLLFYIQINLVNLLIGMIFVLMNVAFVTLFERKILGYIQIRKGPNKLGFMGLLQPFSDVIKLINKEFFFIEKLNFIYYFLSSLMFLILSILLWNLFLYYTNMFSMNMGILFMLSVLSLGVYPIMFAGWSSNSNYSMLGCLRSIAQSISFEVSLFLIMFIIFMLLESFSFYDLFKLNYSLIFFLFPIYMMFIISMLIELNRTPFDLIEGESELVSGFNIEFYSGCFTLIFMSEYLSIIFMSYLMTKMFILNSKNYMFIFYWLYHIYLIIWIRGVLPRIRYDQLMYLCWKKFLSLVLIYLLFIFIYKFILMIYI